MLWNRLHRRCRVPILEGFNLGRFWIPNVLTSPSAVGEAPPRGLDCERVAGSFNDLVAADLLTPVEDLAAVDDEPLKYSMLGHELCRCRFLRSRGSRFPIAEITDHVFA